MPKFDGSIFKKAKSVITFTKEEQTWRIEPDAFAGSGTNAAVVSTFKKGTLINKGTVFSRDFNAIEISGNKSKIVNKTDAEIIGFNGIQTNNSLDFQFNQKIIIENYGTIAGTQAAGIYAPATSELEIYNEGTVVSPIFALYLLSTAGGAGPSVENAGHISGGDIGAYINLLPGQTATFVNHAGGTIDGEGAISLVGEGGTLMLSNKGKIKGTVYLGDGDDVVKNKDGGKAGLMYGRDGNDKFVLGTRSDKIVFDTELDAATNVDRVRNFETGEDRLYLDDDTFALASAPGTLEKFEFRKGTEAVDADDRIIYDRDSGVLAYDADGVDGAEAVQFAQLDEGQKLKYSDITFGDFTLILA